MKLYSNPAYLTMSAMFFLFVFGALMIFGNTAGADITRAITTGDASFINIERLTNPETYVDDVKQDVDSFKGDSNEVKAGDPHSRFN